MDKKTFFITIFTSMVVMFIITTCFYVTPVGKIVYTSILSRSGDSVLSKVAKAEYIIDKRFMGEYDKKVMSDNAMVGFVSSIDDAYTDYFPAYLYRNVTESLEGSYKGIGITGGVKDGYIFIKAVSENSPAMKAGVMQGDIILSINGTDYDADTYSDALNTIKATKEGASVVLKIKRGEEILEKEIVVSRISRGYVKGEILDNNVGYVRIKTFATDIADEFEKTIENLEKQNVQSLIIDLRSNPGGTMEVVVEMTDLLIGEGVILSVKDKDGNEEKYMSDKNQINIPMCVLINSESASASEIMAGALQHYKKATLVGETTFGKGVVQAIYEFDDQSAMKVTVAKYFTPSGECIDGVGIKPDHEVLMPDGNIISEEKIGTDEDVQLKKALELLQ